MGRIVSGDCLSFESWLPVGRIVSGDRSPTPLASAARARRDCLSRLRKPHATTRPTGSLHRDQPPSGL